MTDSVSRLDTRHGGHDGLGKPSHTPEGLARNGPAHSVERLAETASRLAAMVHAPLRRVRIQYGEAVVELEWPQEHPAPGEVAPRGLATTAPEGSPEPAARTDSGQSQHHHVTAPMVGNFYHAPEPGAPPFVNVGDLVEEGQDIGIVEAMKLMNPVQAECSGRVVAVLVEDGNPVEYGQPLIALEPTEPVEDPE
ncbi:acetyl-CoA carboxylase biotin carboxyl carrier protein [Streptantibioticus ferralitis]|uniref:Biotin carboxyl carrier protein of acetyl-CoA carboxylase n=1 Tax=Streptantibioticus ferralitis TaxID=236510 RepID=A0ABT5YWQ7_9ACTN|nr:acetyl-CoA carboxylase biotin carboxyl carrier protein [Streptantibioticus ferralitis]MDF2255918.1 acetyl-CoA carboxylase biotin carboxyl carrier protein [Streptantibioticus ferralitis]